MPSRDIEDRKTPVAEKNRSVTPEPAVIRSAMGEDRGHARQRFVVTCANETGDPAHLVPSVQFGPPVARPRDVPGSGDQVSHFILRLVIRPGNQFRKQTHQETHATRDERDRKQSRQGGFNEAFAAEKFEINRSPAREGADEITEKPNGTEKIHGLLKVAIKEAENEEIENDFDQTFETVIRLAVKTRVMSHNDFSHASAIPSRIDRDETMHLAVKPDILESFAPIRFQGAPVIVQVNARKRRDQP